MTQPKVKETNWEKELKKSVESQGFTEGQQKVIVKLVSPVLSQAIAAQKEEIIQGLGQWLYENGITHKESFIALKNKLNSLRNSDTKKDHGKSIIKTHE